MLFGKREQSCWVVLAVFVSGLVLVAEGNPARADGNRNQPRHGHSQNHPTGLFSFTK